MVVQRRSHPPRSLGIRIGNGPCTRYSSRVPISPPRRRPPGKDSERSLLRPGITGGPAAPPPRLHPEESPRVVPRRWWWWSLRPEKKKKKWMELDRRENKSPPTDDHTAAPMTRTKEGEERAEATVPSAHGEKGEPTPHLRETTDSRNENEGARKTSAMGKRSACRTRGRRRTTKKHFFCLRTTWARETQCTAVPGDDDGGSTLPLPFLLPLYQHSGAATAVLDLHEVLLEYDKGGGTYFPCCHFLFRKAHHDDDDEAVACRIRHFRHRRLSPSTVSSPVLKSTVEGT